jgi:hypothetical protein
MSTDSIKRVDAMRASYKALETNNSSEYGRELQDIKTELKILNDENAYKSTAINNASGSPYLGDQSYFYKDVLYNSPDETSWKEVKSYDEIHNQFATFNLKKLNII